MDLHAHQPRMTDLFFTLGLFCVFTACALLLVTIGLRAYQTTVAQMQDTYSTRTAISYVVEKVRQHDTAGAVALADMEGAPALVLRDTVGEDTYLTYVYADGDTLYELTVREGTLVSRAMGTPIIEVEDFSITDAGNGFWALSATGSRGGTVQCLVHLRSTAA